MVRKKSISYSEGLFERLKSPQYAAEYLNSHLVDDNPDSYQAFLLALRDVATAHGFINIAKKSELGRESMYKMMSKSGNPKISTLAVLLHSIGLKLLVEAKPVKRKRVS